MGKKLARRIATLLLSFAMICSCLFVLSACKKDDDNKPATITSISVTLAESSSYTLSNGTIETNYNGSKIEFTASDFVVTATKSDSTTLVLSQKTDTADGYTLTSTVPTDDITPVGEYKITFAYTGVSSVEIAVNVVKGNVDVSGVTLRSLTYDGTAQTLLVTDILNLPSNVTAEFVSGHTGTGAQNYEAVVRFTYTGDDADSYNAIPDRTITWTMEQGTYNVSNITWNRGATTTYTGQAQTVEIQVDGSLPAGVTIKGYLNNSFTNAGNYTAKVQFNYDSVNYKKPAVADFEWAIEKAPLSITPSPVSVVFGNDAVANGVVYSGFVNGETENTPEVLTGTISYEFGAYHRGADVNGDYKVTISGVDAANYDITFNDGTLNVTKATYQYSAINWVYDDVNKFEYTGFEQKPTVTGVPEFVLYTITAKKAGEANESIGAGSYTAEFTVSSFDNYTFEGTLPTKAYEIKKAPLSITANNKTITFGDAAANDGVTIVGFLGGDNSDVLVGTIQYAYDGYVAGNDAGEYDITVSGVEAENYDIRFHEGTLIVEAITLQYSSVAFAGDTAVDYDGETYALSVTGVPNYIQYAITYTKGGTSATPKNAGTYVATFTVTASNNYTYMGTIPTQTFVINKLALTVTANPNIINFGVAGAPAATPVAYSGFLAGENENTEGIFGESTLAYAYTDLATGLVEYEAGDDIGTYRITPYGLTAENYEISFVFGELTVQPIQVDVSGYAWDNTALTYNGKTQEPKLTGISEFIEASYSYTQDSEPATPKNVGSYTASVEFVADSQNYTVTGSVAPYNFSIAPKALVITANDHTIEFGDAASNAGVTYNGFENGETASVLSGTLAYGYGDYTAGTSGVGDYDITVSGLNSTNYSISFEKGTLTVTKKTFALSNFVWNYTVAYTYTGAVQKPTLVTYPNVLTFNDNYSYTKNSVADDSIGAGNYTAIAIFEESDNYVIEGGVYQATLEYEIQQAPLTVTANNNEIEFNEAGAGAGVSYSGFVNNETQAVLTGTLSYTFTDWATGLVAYEAGTSGVGDYRIVPGGYDEINYKITYEYGKLTVKPIEVALSNFVWDYSSAYTYTGVAQKPTLSSYPSYATLAGYTYTKDAAENDSIHAGSYTATANFEPSANYTIADDGVVEVDYVIGKAALTITANSTTIKYQEAYVGTPVYSGFLGEDEANASTLIRGTFEVVSEYEVGNNVNTEAGYRTYISVTGAALEADDYIITLADGVLKVEKATINLSTASFNYDDSTPFVFDNQAHQPTLTGIPSWIEANAVSYTFVPYPGGMVDVPTADAPKNAGSYTVTANIAPTSNYDVEGNKSIVFRIVAANVDVSTATWNTSARNYDGTAYEPKVQGLPTWVAVQYKYWAFEDQDENGISAINAGSYYAQATVESTDNYTVAGSIANTTFAISKIDLTLKVDDKTIYYYESLNTPTYTPMGLLSGEDISSVLVGTPEFDLDGYSVGEDVGTYTISISNASSLFAQNYNVSTQSGTLTVQKVTIQATEVEWNETNPTYTYNKTAQYPTLSNPLFFKDGFEYVYNADGSLKPINADEYTVVVNFTSSNNYEVEGEVSTTFKINKATIAASSITWNQELDGNNKYTVVYDGQEHTLQVVNLTGLIYGDIDFYPTENTFGYAVTTKEVGTYECGFTVALNGTAASNYTLSQTTYTATLEIVDYVNKIEFNYVDAYSTEIQSTVATDTMTPSFNTTEVVLTGITVTMNEGFESYTYRLFKDKAGTKPVEFENIADFENDVYIAIYNGNYDAGAEIIGTRRVSVDLSYYLNINSNESAYTLNVNNQPISLMTDSDSYTIAPYLTPETGALISAPTTTLAVWDASQNDYIAIDTGAISLVDGFNRIMLKFSFVVDGETYAYQKEITVVKSISSATYSSNVTNNEIWVDSNTSNEINVEEINIEANQNYKVQTKKLVIDETSGDAFLEVTFEYTDEVQSYSNPTVGDTYVCLIKVQVSGKIDRNVSATFETYDDDYVDETNKIIYITEGNSIRVYPGNEYAKIAYLASTSETESVNVADYTDIYFSEVNTSSVFYIKIFSTYNNVLGLGEGEDAEGTWVYYTVIVNERPQVSTTPGLPENVDILIQVDETTRVERTDFEYDMNSGVFKAQVNANLEGKIFTIYDEENDVYVPYTSFQDISLSLEGSGFYSYSLISLDLTNEFDERAVPVTFSQQLGGMVVNFFIKLHDNLGRPNGTLDICIVFADSDEIFPDEGGSGGGENPGGQPVMGDVEYSVIAHDCFSNYLNEAGEIQTGAYVITPGTEEVEGVDYDVITLSNWNETKFIEITGATGSESISLFAVVEGQEQPVYLVTNVTHLMYNFTEAGNYGVVIMSADYSVYTILTIIVTGNFTPFMQITANEKTSTAHIDAEFNFTGDFIFWYEAMSPDEIYNLETYVGDVDSVGATYEIAISTALSHKLYAVDSTGEITSTRLEISNGKLTLNVLESDDGYNYVKFAIYQEANAALQINETVFYVYVFLCDKADRIQYHTLSVGSKTFDVKADITRYGDFGDVAIDNNSGLGYVLIDEEDINESGATTITFTAYTGYQRPARTLDYIIFTEEGYEALMNSLNSIESYDMLLELVAELVSAGMAFDSTTAQIPLTFVEGSAMLYIFVEGVTEEVFSLPEALQDIDDAIIPFMITTSIPDDGDQGGNNPGGGNPSQPSTPYYDYADFDSIDMGEGVELEMELVIAGTTYSTNTNDFYFENQLPEYYVRLDDTQAELVDAQTGKVTITSFTANASGYPIPYELFDLQGSPIEVTNGAFELSVTNHSQFGDALQLRAVADGMGTATFVFVFNDSVPTYAQIKYEEKLTSESDMSISFGINGEEYSSNTHHFYLDSTRADYNVFFVYTRVDFRRFDISYQELEGTWGTREWAIFNAFNISVEGYSFSHFMNSDISEGQEGHIYTTPYKAAVLHSNDVGLMLLFEIVLVSDDNNAQMWVNLQVVFADSVPMPYHSGDSGESDGNQGGGSSGGGDVSSEYISMLHITYGEGNTLTQLMDPYADNEFDVYAGDFTLADMDEATYTVYFAAQAIGSLEGQTTFILNHLALSPVIFSQAGSVVVKDGYNTSNIINLTDYTALNVELAVQENSVSFLVIVTADGDVITYNYTITFGGTGESIPGGGSDESGDGSSGGGSDSSSVTTATIVIDDLTLVSIESEYGFSGDFVMAGEPDMVNNIVTLAYQSDIVLEQSQETFEIDSIMLNSDMCSEAISVVVADVADNSTINLDGGYTASGVTLDVTNNSVAVKVVVTMESYTCTYIYRINFATAV